MKEFLYQIAKGQKKGLFIELIKVVLWLLSLLYAAAVIFRRFLYRIGSLPSVSLEKPVISVGNITTGGTGKTPLTAYLVEHFKANQKKPVILTRGYMSEAGYLSDEATWYTQALEVPVLVGADRASHAKEFLSKESCDIFIMDDGFQHLRLKRNLDIVTIDATDPWGSEYYLPRGFLREPVSTLKRADIVVITKTDQASAEVALIKERLEQIGVNALIVQAVHEPKQFIDLKVDHTVELERFKNTPVCALSSIASNESFERSLYDLGIQSVKHFSFKDHHVYRKEDIAAIISFCEGQQIKAIITTEKDKVKLHHLIGQFPEELSLYALKITIKITEHENEFLQRIDHLS